MLNNAFIVLGSAVLLLYGVGTYQGWELFSPAPVSAAAAAEHHRTGHLTGRTRSHWFYGIFGGK